MESHEKENKYIRAKERVREIRKFYTNLMFYIVFITALAGLNYYTNELRYPWFLWAALGWGIGLIFQAFKAFHWLPFMGKDWEDKKIKELMEKEKETNETRWN
ncbi:2TM domain-containing protein [Constantimarinum furrinae]|uniref:2TM domain-containing protein n=1 Tax=Constantimarinum furrinae TaxID=2562285 RepID=A0A7G8PVU1_9FLAO|nr:2TM domain-containing protein [Constantimarinum furrinae]QNJ98457.1 hypothetical protein ALE3EI_1910 [Constantimarinum furrinae]